MRLNIFSTGPSFFSTLTASSQIESRDKRDKGDRFIFRLLSLVFDNHVRRGSHTWSRILWVILMEASKRHVDGRVDAHPGSRSGFAHQHKALPLLSTHLPSCLNCALPR